MKEKKDIIIHISIIAVILVVLLISVYKLVKWNNSNEDLGNYAQTDDDLTVEAEDYITAMDPALLEENDDGVTTIVFLGDEMLADYTDKDSIPEQTASLLNTALGTNQTKVYNLGFPGMYQSTVSPVWEESHSEDAFSLYWLSKCIALNDYTLLHNTVEQAANGDARFQETIQVLEGIDFNDVDVITMMYGVHDYLDGRLITDVADMNNITSYSGALKSSIEAIREAYPHIRIVVMSPTFCLLEQDGQKVNCDTANTGYGILSDYMIAGKAIAVELNVTYLDNYFGVPIYANNYTEYLEDDIHLNAAGRTLVAERVVNVLAKQASSIK